MRTLRELVPVTDEQVALVRESQAVLSTAQTALDAACMALVAGRAPPDARVVGGLTEGFLVVEYERDY